jgi:hypothetical protein
MFGANPIQDIFFNEPRINDGLREAHLHNVSTFLANKKPGEAKSLICKDSPKEPSS